MPNEWDIRDVGATRNAIDGKPGILAVVAKNAAANLFRIGTVWIITLFLPPLLVRVMDKTEYGIWLLLLQLVAYVTTFDGGIQIAVARFVARSQESSDRSYIARFLSSAGAFLIVAGFAIIVFVATASWQLGHVFRTIPLAVLPQARQALFVVGVSQGLTLPFSVLAGFFLGLQKNELIAFAVSLGRFAGAAGTAWAAYHHQGLLMMAIWTGFGNIAQCVIYLILWRKEKKRNSLKISWPERTIIREFLAFCSAMFVSQLSGILITGMDMPIVTTFDFPSVAYYGVAVILSNVLIVFHAAVVNTLLPITAGMSTNEDAPRLGQVLLKTTRFATALLCLITLPLLLLMPLFLRIWVGADYATHTVVIGQILVFAQFIRLTMFPYAMIGFAAGQQRRMLISPLAEGATNLVCSLILVQIMGARGVAIGTLIGSVVGVWLHLTVSLRKTDCVRVDRMQLIWRGIMKQVICVVPFVGCAFLIPYISGPLLQAALVLFAELLLFALFWRISFNESERGQFTGLVRHFASITPTLRS